MTTGQRIIKTTKHNATTNTIKAFNCGADNSEDILEDSLVEFKNRRPRAKHINHYFGTPVRRIVVKRADKSTPIVLVTNDLKHSGDEIALMYKQRWGIELFFKWLKQNLKIKQFLGRSENAVKIQIYTALITYILTHLYRSRNKVKLTLKCA